MRGLSYTDASGNVWRVPATALLHLTPARRALEAAVARGADENTLERLREAIRAIVAVRNEC
jgi:hypothetical protein